MYYAAFPTSSRAMLCRTRVSAIATIWSRNTSTSKYEKEMTAKTLALAQSITNRTNGGDEKSILTKRRALSRAITLIESRSYHHIQQGDLLLNYLIEANLKVEAEAQKQNNENCHSNNINDNSRPSFRIGIAGAPGAGK